MKVYPSSWQYTIINYLDLDSFYTLMCHIVNLHSQYVLFTFFYPLFFSCCVHCTAVYTVCCPVHSCSLTVVLPERTIYSHFVYFVSKVSLLAEIGTPHFARKAENRHFSSYKNIFLLFQISERTTHSTTPAELF